MVSIRLNGLKDSSRSRSGPTSLRSGCLFADVSAVADIKVKVSNATELRDGIEYLCQGSLYPIFLKRLVPVFLKLLEGQPVFTNTSYEQVGYDRTPLRIYPD